MAVAALVGFPVVLKLPSSKVLHKTDVGGVRLHLHDEQDVRAAFAISRPRFPEVARAGLAAPSSTCSPCLTGVETLIGIADDPTFGPLVAFGLGGVQTEVLHDVAFRIAPLSDTTSTAFYMALEASRCFKDIEVGRRQTLTPLKRSCSGSRCWRSASLNFASWI